MVKISTRYWFFALVIASATFFGDCYDVIIIGAGASGIAAGMNLLKHGVDDFLILEAGDRIGGRIHSTKFGDSFVDLGAEWCLGVENNKVYTIAEDYQLLKPVNDKYDFISSDTVRHSQSSIDDVLDCRKCFSDNIYSIPTAKDNSTLLDGFVQYCNKMISKVAADPLLRRRYETSLNEMASLALTHESFYSWNDIPAKLNYRKCLGQLQHSNGLGFHVILKLLMHDFPKKSTGDGGIHSKIVYNSPVQTIYWKREGTDVLVESHPDSYIAKHVIFTPSLGVLKSTHVILFEPALPQSKINAIDSLGFEGILKVFLKFNRPWWTRGGKEFPPTLLVWRGDEISRAEDVFLGAFPDNPLMMDPWVISLTQIMPSPNNPNVIEAWFTDRGIDNKNMCKRIEKIPDLELIDGIKFVLSLFFKEYKNSQPDSILRSSWNTNQYFVGSHSYETRRPSPFSGSCNVDLATPLYKNSTPVVLFAGEATSKNHYSTVHGAIEAGEREAYRLISRTSLVTGEKLTC